MRPLVESDYVELLAEAARCLPAELGVTFLGIGRKALSAAYREGKGARFIEEVLTEALMETLPRNPPERRHESVRLSAG